MVQRGACSFEINGFISQFKVGKYNRRNEGIVLNGFREKCIETINAAEKEPSVSAFEIGAGVKLIVL